MQLEENDSKCTTETSPTWAWQDQSTVKPPSPKVLSAIALGKAGPSQLPCLSTDPNDNDSAMCDAAVSNLSDGIAALRHTTTGQNREEDLLSTERPFFTRSSTAPSSFLPSMPGAAIGELSATVQLQGNGGESTPTGAEMVGRARAGSDELPPTAGDAAMVNSSPFGARHLTAPPATLMYSPLGGHVHNSRDANSSDRSGRRGFERMGDRKSVVGDMVIDAPPSAASAAARHREKASVGGAEALGASATTLDRVPELSTGAAGRRSDGGTSAISPLPAASPGVASSPLRQLQQQQEHYGSYPASATLESSIGTAAGPHHGLALTMPPGPQDAPPAYWDPRAAAYAYAMQQQQQPVSEGGDNAFYAGSDGGIVDGFGGRMLGHAYAAAPYGPVPHLQQQQPFPRFDFPAPTQGYTMPSWGTPPPPAAANGGPFPPQALGLGGPVAMYFHAPTQQQQPFRSSGSASHHHHHHHAPLPLLQRPPYFGPDYQMQFAPLMTSMGVSLPPAWTPHHHQQQQYAGVGPSGSSLPPHTGQQQQPQQQQPQQRRFNKRTGGQRGGDQQQPLQRTAGYDAAGISGGGASPSSTPVSPSQFGASSAVAVARAPNPSPKLIEYKAQRLQVKSFADIQGAVADFACDAAGSRLLVALLERRAGDAEVAPFSDADRAALVAEFCAATIVRGALLMDAYGHTVAIGILKHGATTEQLHIAALMRDAFVKLSLHVSGCRVVQMALQVLPVEVKAALAAELDGHVLKTIQDQHGNHVVQKIIEQVRLRRARMCFNRR